MTAAARGALYVPPERWSAIDTTPASIDAWIARLGGGAGGVLAMQGALNRGELVDVGGGRVALASGQLALPIGDPHG